jgi:iduronate 2-sulfatase
VSFIDACIGRLMDGLRELGLEENTIVVFWGDHGWKLGEHGSWCKQTNYNIDTRVPLLIRAPGVGAKGQKSDRLTELVDLYPTLCDLAGIEIPAYMEGTSLKPLLEQPELELKSAAFSQYVRRPKNSPDGKRYMGYSMVTSQYHYVEWYQWNDETKSAGDLAARELYDLQIDPDENINIAGHPENAETVQDLAEKLKAGWRAALLAH